MKKWTGNTLKMLEMLEMRSKRVSSSSDLRKGMNAFWGPILICVNKLQNLHSLLPSLPSLHECHWFFYVTIILYLNQAVGKSYIPKPKTNLIGLSGLSLYFSLYSPPNKFALFAIAQSHSYVFDIRVRNPAGEPFRVDEPDCRSLRSLTLRPEITCKFIVRMVSRDSRLLQLAMNKWCDSALPRCPMTPKLWPQTRQAKFSEINARCFGFKLFRLFKASLINHPFNPCYQQILMIFTTL